MRLTNSILMLLVVLLSTTPLGAATPCESVELLFESNESPRGILTLTWKNPIEGSMLISASPGSCPRLGRDFTITLYWKDEPSEDGEVLIPNIRNPSVNVGSAISTNCLYGLRSPSEKSLRDLEAVGISYRGTKKRVHSSNFRVEKIPSGCTPPQDFKHPALQ